MLVTRYLIEKTSHYGPVTLVHYYGGKADGNVDYFVSQKLKARRYALEEEAIRDMNNFRDTHCEIYSFRVISVSCRV